MNMPMFQRGGFGSVCMGKCLAFGLLGLLVLSVIPTVAACETEVANALEGKFPSPTGISPNKDDSIRESVRLAGIGQHVGREMLWQVLMGANLTERAIADEINRAMVENGSTPNGHHSQPSSLREPTARFLTETLPTMAPVPNR